MTRRPFAYGHIRPPEVKLVRPDCPTCKHSREVEPYEAFAGRALHRCSYCGRVIDVAEPMGSRCGECWSTHVIMVAVPGSDTSDDFIEAACPWCTIGAMPEETVH